VQAFALVYAATRAGALRYVRWDHIDLESTPGTIHFAKVKEGLRIQLQLLL
jgi:hypothetical protein